MPTQRLTPVRRREWLALLGIVALAALLRLFMIDQPTIWGDEAATWSRVCGTWAELVEQLRSDGFVPIHYEIYWLLHQWLGELTPFWMRIVPAVAGILTVPAVWWVARQLLGPRVGLLAALLVATSAFMLVYSRDAKMYALVWFFAVAHVGCLLAWVRSRDRLWWWAWVLSGCAMLGTHAPSALILPLDLVVIISSLWRRGERWPSVAWLVGGAVLGAAIMAIGPVRHYGFGTNQQAWYYVKPFSHYIETRNDNGHHLGIGWVGWYNQARSGDDMLLTTTSAYLTGWEWPAPESLGQEPPEGRRRSWFADNMGLRTQQRVADWPRRVLKTATIALLVGLGLGVLPWRRRWTGMAQDFRGFAGRGKAVLWLGTWILLPLFAAYCLSYPRDASGGTERLRHLSDVLVDNLGRWWPGAALVAGLLLIGWLLISGSHAQTRAIRSGGWLAGTLTLGALLLAVNYAIADAERHSIWMPRYFGVVAPGLLILAAWLWLRLPGKPLRIAVVALYLVINLGQYTGRLLSSEPPVDLLAADIVDAKYHPRTRIFIDSDTSLTNPSPAGGWVGTWFGEMPLTYYVLTLDPEPAEHAPPDLRSGRNRVLGRNYGDFYESRRAHERLARQQDELDRVIFWTARQQLYGEAVQAGPPLDTILDRRQWRRVSVEPYQVFDHWRWSYWSFTQREVWERYEPQD